MIDNPPMATAGYSGTPLAKKLGIKPGHRVAFVRAPEGYAELLALPEEVHVLARPGKRMDVVQFFTKRLGELERALPRLTDAIAPDGALWVSWPKKASKVATDVTEDEIRNLALSTDLVDVKVCAVDEVWSGLKLVIRKELRQAQADKLAVAD